MSEPPIGSTVERATIGQVTQRRDQAGEVSEWLSLPSADIFRELAGKSDRICVESSAERLMFASFRR